MATGDDLERNRVFAIAPARAAGTDRFQAGRRVSLQRQGAVGHRLGHIRTLCHCRSTPLGRGGLCHSRFAGGSPPVAVADHTAGRNEVCQTVTVEFRDLFIPESDVLYVRSPAWMKNADMHNLALQSQFALGCAQAGIDIMGATHAKKRIEVIREAAATLQKSLDQCKEDARHSMKNRDDIEMACNVRARAIELAGRCAHAAVVASSGAGNSMEHPAQRVYREVLIFTVLGQNPATMDGAPEKTIRAMIPRDEIG